MSERVRLVAEVGDQLFELREVNRNTFVFLQMEHPGLEGVPTFFSVGAMIEVWPKPSVGIQMHELKPIK